MVDKSSELILFVFVLPALASSLVAGAAWRLPSGQGAQWRWAPAALLALISVGLGTFVYLTHSSDVSDSRALTGALLALGGSALPLGLYYAMGRFIRRLRYLVGWWLASLPPLFYYSFLVMFFVVVTADCAPGCLG